MKATVFRLTGLKTEYRDGNYNGPLEGIFRVPTLPAYSILHHHLELGNAVRMEDFSVPDTEIHGDVLRMTPIASTTHYLWEMNATLTISFSGIRDYSLFFPHVENDQLRVRLGQFAEEAEKAFEASAWMSFALMAGAVIEGLLMNQFGRNKRFKQLIDLSVEEKVISAEDLISLHEVREARNRVHADRFQDPFVGRKLAMDVYVIYDRLLKRRWDLDGLK
ncbi:hypothetical protein [Marinobacterium jannaschii]|uniref:hypothetical protein n=1 Tax=Marinobacterium jannaschii TaxID=64970 RepID=UPI000481EFF2|nr:hypothetical protein [Marinobacterium jannaschii]